MPTQALCMQLNNVNVVVITSTVNKTAPNISILADRTNARAYAAVLRLSVVCNVCIVAKQCVLPKNCLKKKIGNGLWGIECSRDRWRHWTLKSQGHDPIRLWPKISKIGYTATAGLLVLKVYCVVVFIWNAVRGVPCLMTWCIYT